MSRLALLFDLDGTLLDSIDLLLDCMTHAFEGRSRAPTREQWVAGIGTPLRAQLAEWADDDAMVQALLERYRDYQELHLERMTRAYPGIPELLRDLRSEGHAMGIVTSKGRGMTSRSLACIGFTDFFDVTVTVESTKTHKPGPEPVLFALEQLGMPAERALFVGDSPHDMHAGRAAGVATAACLWGPFGRDELAPAHPSYWAVNSGQLREAISHFASSNHQPPLTVSVGDLLGDHDRTSRDHASS